MSRLRCMLVVPDGPSRRVGRNGLVIGRQDDCDLVALDPSVSRRHALVRVVGARVEVVPLGRGPIAVNGAAIDRPHAVVDGDELAVPGLVVRVAIERDVDGPAGFLLERDGARFGIAHTPFVIGGGDGDDLIVQRWPAAAVVLHLAQDGLFVELRVGEATHDGAALVIGELIELRADDRLESRGEEFVVRTATDAPITTAVGERGELPTHVEVELLPRGGRIELRIGGRSTTVYLADRRLDLMMALLDPPAGYRAGDFIPDDTVRAVVWPRNASVTRQEINTLISRCRRDLIEAGLAGPRLLERAPGGGGTRLQLAPGATVLVH